jgi:hypothetical protein
MIYAMSTLALIVLVGATPASAVWGGNCTAEDNPNHHCYAIIQRYANRLGAVAADAFAYANVPGWQSGDFATMETWIHFAEPRSYYEWIETGSIVGAGYDCCSPHRFHARTSALDGYNEWIEPQPQGGAPGSYPRYGLMNLIRLQTPWIPSEAFDVIYEGLGGVCGENWCKVNRFGSWPDKFNLQQAGLEVAANTMPTLDARQWVAAVGTGWPFEHPLLGPYEALCFGVVEGHASMEITTNPDVQPAPPATQAMCGGNKAIGQFRVQVLPGVTGNAATKPPQPTTTDPILGKPHDVKVHHEGQLESLESKNRFHPKVPTPPGSEVSGDHELVKRGAGGVIEALWVGDGPPNAQVRREVLEPQPVLPPGAPAGPPVE